MRVLPCLLLLVPLAACDSGRPAATGVSSAAQPAAVAVGQPAPDVTLVLHDGTSKRLRDLHGSHVLIYFYPKDDTPGCTTEAQGLRDSFAHLETAGVKVFGVSFDDAESHQAFIDKHDLPFPLVIDDGALADAFEVPHLLGYPKRQSILVGPDGDLKNIWRDVDPARHASQVLAAATGR